MEGAHQIQQLLDVGNKRSRLHGDPQGLACLSGLVSSRSDARLLRHVPGAHFHSHWHTLASSCSQELQLMQIVASVFRD